jgi:hypothetical protein
MIPKPKSVVVCIALCAASANAPTAPTRNDVAPAAETRAAVPAIEELRREQAQLFEGAASLYEQNAALIATLCAEDPLLPYCPQREVKFVFVTSTTHYGNLPGISAADFFCNVRASAAGLSGYFKAWISDSEYTAPKETFTRPEVDYVLPDPDRTIVANGWDGLTTQPLLYPINHDENGTLVEEGGIGPSAEVRAWTATDHTGAHKVLTTSDGNPVALDCDDWLDASPQGVFAAAGNANATDARWSYDTYFDIPWSCAQKLRLYCFEQ